MTDAERDVDNLTDFLMRATHDQLVAFAQALLLEVIARGLPCDDACSHLLAGLRKSRSEPRAEPLARPPAAGFGSGFLA